MSEKIQEAVALRTCLREPIPEIAYAARLLDNAVSSHLRSDVDEAAQLISLANIPAIREWSESLWGRNSPYVKVHFTTQSLLHLRRDRQTLNRMPTSGERRELHLRDGYHCRFCGIPVIRRQVRIDIAKAYPISLPWGRENSTQHAAFQAMWAQYDHLLPHSKGGTNGLDNVVVTCAPCNFGRMNYTLKEVGLLNPLSRSPVQSAWDGLERFRTH